MAGGSAPGKVTIVSDPEGVEPDENRWRKPYAVRLYVSQGLWS
jgi:hypothetical protein